MIMYEDYSMWSVLVDRYITWHRNYEAMLKQNRPRLANLAYETRYLIYQLIEHYLMEQACRLTPGKPVALPSSVPFTIVERLRQSGKPETRLRLEEALKLYLEAAK
jgi:hypothetical protein